MKKLMALVLISMLAIMSASVMAAPKKFNFFKVELEKKDPVTWDTVSENGYMHGYTYMSYCRDTRSFCFKDVVNVRAEGLKRKTKYTLIYYGDEDHNDEYPYATCLATAKTDRRGKLKITKAKTRTMLFEGFLKDSEEQKFWVVPSKDVNCRKGEMKNWNPSEYLFEHNVI